MNCPTCGNEEDSCCRFNEIRRLEHMAACGRIDERDATIAELKRRIRAASRLLNRAGELGYIFDVDDVLAELGPKRTKRKATSSKSRR